MADGRRTAGGTGTSALDGHVKGIEAYLVDSTALPFAFLVITARFEAKGVALLGSRRTSDLFFAFQSLRAWTDALSRPRSDGGGLRAAGIIYQDIIANTADLEPLRVAAHNISSTATPERLRSKTQWDPVRERIERYQEAAKALVNWPTSVGAHSAFVGTANVFTVVGKVSGAAGAGPHTAFMATLSDQEWPEWTQGIGLRAGQLPYRLGDFETGGPEALLLLLTMYDWQQSRGASLLRVQDDCRQIAELLDELGIAEIPYSRYSDIVVTERSLLRESVETGAMIRSYDHALRRLRADHSWDDVVAVPPAAWIHAQGAEEDARFLRAMLDAVADANVELDARIKSLQNDVEKVARHIESRISIGLMREERRRNAIMLFLTVVLLLLAGVDLLRLVL